MNKLKNLIRNLSKRFSLFAVREKVIVGIFIILFLTVVTPFRSYLTGYSDNLTASLIGLSDKQAKIEPMPKPLSKSRLGEQKINALAEANNMTVLKGDQVAIMTKEFGQPAKEKSVYSIDLSDGTQHTIETDKDIAFDLIQGSDSENILVDNSPDLKIITLFSQSNPEEKVDIAVEHKLSENGQAPVIIRFSKLERYYTAGVTKEKQANKRKKFNEVKGKINTLIAGQGKIKNDLLIINGVSADINRTALDRLQQSPEVEKIELDKEYKIILDASLDEIGAKDVWTLLDANSTPLTGEGKVIAILDTGIDYIHSDLGGCLGSNCKVIGGYDFVNKDNDPMDDNGHGTHVAATAAGKGLLFGVAPDAKILAYKVCDPYGWCFGSAIISAIDYATDPNRDGNQADHADVATMSLGGPGDPDDFMSKAVDNSSAAGVVYTIAAGNDGPKPSTINSPGTARSAITVAAACKASQIGVNSYCSQPIANFSSRGPLIWNGEDIKKPDIAAPGVLICAARWDNVYSNLCFDDKHVRISGTSMATPHLAGVAALVRQAFPNYSPTQIKQQIKNTARNLGMSYDTQGAGMANLKAAIPLVRKVTINPVNWEISSDPTTKLSSHSQTFSVTPLVADIATLSVDSKFSVPGITFTADKTILQVANKTTDSFEGTLTVDNDEVPAGLHYGSITLSEAGVAKGIVPIYLTVKPTIIFPSLAEIDYGIDDPSLNSWTSEAKQITLINLRKDRSQSLTASLSRFPTGVTLQTAPSSPFAIPPDSLITLETKISVSNSGLASGFYAGALEFSGPTLPTTIIPAKFTKYYVLIIDTSAGSSVLPSRPYIMVWLHDRSQTYLSRPLGYDTDETTFYLNNPGKYDIIVKYSNVRNQTFNTYSDNTVFKEGIDINQGLTTIEVGYSQANHLVELIGTDETGAVGSDLRVRSSRLTYLPTGRKIFVETTAGGLLLTRHYYSDMSSSYKNENVYSNSQPAEKLYYFYSSFTGLSTDKTVTNNPSDFQATEIAVDINRSSGWIMPLVPLCQVFEEPFCVVGFRYGGEPTLPFKQIIYSLVPAEARYYVYQRVDSFRNGCPKKNAACPYVFVTPVLELGSRQRRINLDLLKGKPLPRLEGNTLYNGLGPSFWAAKFENSPLAINLNLVFSPSKSRQPPFFLRQDYAKQEYDAIFYILRQGATEIPGVLPPFHLTSDAKNSPPPTIPLSGRGLYEFRIDSFPYQIKGQDMKAQVVAKFDTRAADPNPPAIERLYYFANNARSEVYNETVPNRLEFELNPIGSKLDSVTASYSPDGINFTPLTLANRAKRYSATLPFLANLNKITLKLEATDSAKNYLSYAFELPRGEVPGGIEDTTPPIGTIKINNDATSTASAIVSLNLLANDTNGSGLDSMRFSNASNGPWIDWVPYATIYNNWDLTDPIYGGNTGLGTKTVWVQYKDKAGNISSGEIKDSIEYQGGFGILPTEQLMAEILAAIKNLF